MLRLNTEQLHTFLAVVRQGGVRRAAQALHLTQPAVTARIKNFEAALACTLFERSSTGMTLTKRGELLLAHAEKFEHLTEQVQRDVVDPAGAEGHLRIGASETIAQCWLPTLVTRLHETYPKLEIELFVDVSHNLAAALGTLEIDLGILLGPLSDPAVENLALPGFEMGWYASARADPGTDPHTHLRRPVMTYARNTRPFRELKALMFEHVGPDARLFPSSSLSACFKLVEADLGIAVLPRALGAALVAEGRIRQFDPGWVPDPLQFTVSYLAEPQSHLNAMAARLARSVAEDYAVLNLR
jgi:DNA-binding transcriptional LysR family regulator